MAVPYPSFTQLYAESTSVMAGDSILDKFRRGAQKASIQATAFVMDSSSKVANGSRDFVQGFSLPAEAEKSANILQSFLGAPPFESCDEWTRGYQ